MRAPAADLANVMLADMGGRVTLALCLALALLFGLLCVVLARQILCRRKA